MRQHIPRVHWNLLTQFSILSFVVLAVIAAGLGYGLEQKIIQNVLEQESNSAADQVQLVINPFLRGVDLKGPLPPALYGQLDQQIRERILNKHIVRINIWSPQGVLDYSNNPTDVGRQYPLSDNKELVEALGGTIGMELSSLAKAENGSDENGYGQLLEVYVPIWTPDNTKIQGAYEIYHDLSVLQPELDDTQRYLFFSFAVGFAVLYLSLFAIVRKASGTLIQRNEEVAQLYEQTQNQAEKLEVLLKQLGTSYDATLAALSEALDARDHETEGHSRRVAALAHDISVELGIRDAGELASIERGALLHDIGKIGISDRILLKPGPLTESEWQEMRKHPAVGAKIIQRIDFLQDALPIVLYHQERFDGSGYPFGLRGAAIPLAARIFAVADVYDALTSDRPYRRAMSTSAALAEIEKKSDIWFDPSVVEVFRELTILQPQPAVQSPLPLAA